METLEFIIYPNGRVEERVTGIVGSSCAEVTEAIEGKLGIVAYRELTSENFAKDEQKVMSRIAMQVDGVDGSNFSQW